MARTPEQFSLTYGTAEIFLADDVNGSAPGVTREIILFPGWAPQITREVQVSRYLDAALPRAFAHGNRLLQFDLTVARTFESLAKAVAFRATAEAGLPTSGEQTLNYVFGNLRGYSLGALAAVNIDPANSFGLRVQTLYRWVGQPFIFP